jgi:alpha/beta hydrolase family protein
MQQHILKTILYSLLTLITTCFVATVTEARITQIVFNSRESPTLGGTSFGKVGQYEKLVGRAFGEVDPNDRRNAVIADIRLAPRNAKGMVEYSMDIYLLKPVYLSNSSHRVLFDINNRGDKRALVVLNDNAASGNDPTTAADAGNGFLMRQGYVIVWSGWDVTAAPGKNRLTITVPVARNPDGSSIVGPALEEFVKETGTMTKGALTYPAASLDKSRANLTVRNHFSDRPTPIPETGWEYIDEHAIRLLPAGTAFQPGTLYEFTYPATNPVVAGLGFAATRDFAAFLRHAAADDEGTANPLAGGVQFFYTFGISQASRFMHDFLYLGFNEDEQGRRVFDASYNYVGAGSGGFFNYRFAQPGRTHRQHIARWYPELQFPFTNQVIFDSITGRTDGRLRRCLATNTCPKIFEVNAANNYWAKAGSLLDTDTSGKDLRLDKATNVRIYLFSSLTANAATEATGANVCQQSKNSVPDNPGHRALLVALDDWVSRGREPPPSQVPRRSNGTLVPPLPQESMGFPRIPGVKYNGLLHTGDAFNFGPSFDQGILTVLPPVIRRSAYPVLVPKTDRDGIDVAGIRLPEIAVPQATYTGWSLLAGPAAGDGCYGAGAGQQINFARTKAERLASGDPRLSMEERYHTHDGYVREVVQAVRKLVKDRLLLEEDAERYIHAGQISDVLR